MLITFHSKDHYPITMHAEPALELLSLMGLEAKAPGGLYADEVPQALWQLQEALAELAPLLLVSLVSGLLISMLQAATQINEMTLSFIPKILAVVATIIVAGPWMLNLLLDYMRSLFANLPYIIG